VKKILILGAGLVAGALVRYLLAQEGFEVKVASRTLGKAQALVGDAKNGSAEQINVDNRTELEHLISKADLSTVFSRTSITHLWQSCALSIRKPWLVLLM